MPIKVKQNLPAQHILEQENIFVMTEQRAMTQDIRPKQGTFTGFQRIADSNS